VLSPTSEQQRNSHRLRGGTGVRSPLTDKGQQWRRILCNSAIGRSDLFLLAGMQDKRKGPPVRAGGPSYAAISTARRPTRPQLRCWAELSVLPLPRGPVRSTP
jgi:hypothetical protein